MSYTQPIIVFDTSVILSGLSSARGASHALLVFAKKRKIAGVVNRTIIREALTHADKVHLTPEYVAKHIQAIFMKIAPAPTQEKMAVFNARISDPQDTHLLATAIEVDASYLVTLDRRHLLKQAESITEVTILSPRELLHALRKHH